MSNIPEPWLDFTKSMMDLDLTKAADELTKMVAELNVPGVDMDALVASQKDNLEALTMANRVALEGMKSVAEWQVRILKETLTGLTRAANELAAVSTPQEVVGKQTDLAKQAFETAVKQMRELAEIVTKANQAASDAVVKRIPESLDEIKDVLKISQQTSTS